MSNLPNPKRPALEEGNISVQVSKYSRLLEQGKSTFDELQKELKDLQAQASQNRRKREQEIISIESDTAAYQHEIISSEYQIEDYEDEIGSLRRQIRTELKNLKEQMKDRSNLIAGCRADIKFAEDAIGRSQQKIEEVKLECGKKEEDMTTQIEEVRRRLMLWTAAFAEDVKKVDGEVKE